MFITLYFQPTNEKPEINDRLQHRCTELYSPNKWFSEFLHHSVQFSSVAQSCLTLCDTVNRSTPGFPVHHQLSESTQTHVHWVSDAIQPPHPLSSPSPPAFNLSQHPGLFQLVSSSHQVALASVSVLPMNIQDWFPLGLTGLISLLSKGYSRIFNNTQFKSINSSVLSFLYSPTLTSIHD